MTEYVPGVLLTTQEGSFPEETFKMGVLESIIQQLSGIKITHEFMPPGTQGVKDATRWGFRIKAILPNTVFRTHVPAQKLACGLKAALAAGGFDGENAVVSTEQGVWMDGRTVADFIDSISKSQAPDIDNEKLRSDMANRGAKLSEQPMHILEIDWSLPAAQAFMSSVKAADFSKGGRRL